MTAKGNPTWAVHYQFETFYHPYVWEFIRRLNAQGIDGLLKWHLEKGVEKSVQQEKDELFFESDYGPNRFAMLPKDQDPREKVELSPDGAYSLYNRELFFYAPMLIATLLSQNQRFEEAQRWFHYIFDPTDGSKQEGTQRFWKFLSFWDTAKNDPENEVQALLHPKNDAARKELSQQVGDWRRNPFQPHLVARHRRWAYQKAVVMKYLDNLITWADLEFQQNTLESINQATLLYILAADILGPRPVEIPPPVKPKVTTYKDLKLEDFSDAVVQSENLVFGWKFGGQGNGQKLPETLQFCIPKNDKLLGYWDTVADRLFKIRHCMNIEGVVRQLPLFEPPISPELLVKAAAAGVDLGSVLSDMNAPLPHYRFSTMLQRATELCADVKALGSALLSALEKRDAEALAMLRSGQEISLLAAVRQVKEQQVIEAQNSWEGLNKSKIVIQVRHDYYARLSTEFMNSWELAHSGLSNDAKHFQEAQGVAQSLAAVLRLLPEIKIGAPTGMGVTYGGANLGDAIQAFGTVMGVLSSSASMGASMSATQGSYQRRMEEWNHQLNLASKELDQIDKQIAAADIRRQITQLELANHDKQTDNAKAVDEFMRSKFTNEELFDWMAAETSGMYFQTYQLAYNMARRAEKAFQFERVNSDASFIKFGYWDSLKKGLLAGERLHYDLRRMEAAYLDQNKRDYEITKHISLVLLNPLALIALKETGHCIVDLSEPLFAADYPSHYMCLIKSVSLTIPCVTGPYTSVNCTLTLLKSSIRDKTDPNAKPLDSFGAVQSIATSHAQNDSGMFELNFRDERYLPFEGYGVISQWLIEMPQEDNAFDFETISDVIINLNYTAHEGGELLREAARKRIFPPVLQQEATLGPTHLPKQENLLRLFSLKHEFSNEWYRFLHPADKADKQTLQFDLTQERFPFIFRGRKIEIQKVELFLKFKDINDPSKYPNGTPLGDYAAAGPLLTLYLTPPKPKTLSQPLRSDPFFMGGLPHADKWADINQTLFDFKGQGIGLGAWSLEAHAGEGDGDIGKIAATLQGEPVKVNGGFVHHLKPEVIEDIYMVCHYSAS